jgi:NACHT domain- and WD repeat-containing protein
LVDFRDTQEPMALPVKTFRVFVSSTFSDLRAERDAFQKRVFPRLRLLCMEAGCRFQAIDLRWGISEEAGRDQLTMKICLDEIARCQRTTPRPNFIVLLGDRYGWRPLPSQIPAADLEAICGVISEERRALLESWYPPELLDENSVPAQRCLRPRTANVQDQAAWLVVERSLARILRDAAAVLPWPEHQRRVYQASAVEQEIGAGALTADSTEDQAFCFFRTIEGLGQDAAVHDFVDLDETGQPDLEAREALDRLKQRLHETLPPGNVRAYNIRWTDEGLSTTYIDALCDDVLECLSRAIRSEIGRLAEESPLEREIALHQSFGCERARFFMGRTEPLQKLRSYLQGHSSTPLVITGLPGSGKTALLAKISHELAAADHDAAVIVRFVGASALSTNGEALRDSISREIMLRFGVEDSSLPEDHAALFQALPRWFSLATAARRLVLIIDAIDQFSDVNRVRNLRWLTARLPSNVKLIVSVLPSPWLDTLKDELLPTNLLELGPMPPTDGGKLLDAWLVQAGRTLQERQRAEVLGKFTPNGLPLYLKLAFEEARRWRSFDTVAPGTLGETSESLIRSLFARLSAEKDHGAVLVSRSLGYLAAARFGLSEDELIDILSADEECFREVVRRSRHEPPEHRLPVAIWSRLYFDLEPYLAERSAQGANLLTFYHRQFREVATQLFLEGTAETDRHRTLAFYFGPQKSWIAQGVPNSRKAAELPAQQAGGKLWEPFAYTLTDLDFIEAKCSAGMTHDLVADYTTAAQVPLGSNGMRRTLSEFAAFVRAQSHILAGNPALLLQQAANEPRGTAPAEVARHRIDAGAAKRPWLQWINRPKSRLEAEMTFVGHEATVRACAFSADGRQIASASDDRTLKVWDAATGAELATLSGHQAAVTCCCFSADGQFVLSGSEDKTLRLWDTASGTEIRKFSGHKAAVIGCSFVAGGSFAVSMSRDKTIRRWELASGKEVIKVFGRLRREWQRRRDAIYFRAGFFPLPMIICGVAFGASEIKQTSTLPDALAFGIVVGSAIFGPLVGLAFLAYYSAFIPSYRDIIQERKETGGPGQFTPDGLHAAWSENGTVRLWDATTARVARVASPPHRALSFLISRISTIIGVHSYLIPCLRFFPHTKRAATACFVSADANRVVTGFPDGSMVFWDMSTRKERARLKGRTAGILACCLSHDGMQIVSGAEDGSLQLWNAAEAAYLGLAGHHGKAVTACAFAPAGTRLASGSADATLKIWQIDDLRSPVTDHAQTVTSIAFAPESERFATSSRDGTVKVWGGFNGEQTSTLHGHSAAVNACQWSPDGLSIISGSADFTIRLWNAQTLETTAALTTSSGVALGRLLARMVKNRLISRRFPLIDRQVPYFLEQIPYMNRRLANQVLVLSVFGFYLPFFKYSLFKYSDYGIRANIWTAVILACYGVIGSWISWARGGGVISCAYSLDGKRILACNTDGTVKLWDVAAGAATTVLSPHEAKATACLFLPSGSVFLEAGSDGKIRMRDVASAQGRDAIAGDRPKAAYFSTDPVPLKIRKAWFNLYAGVRYIFVKPRVTAAAVSPDGGFVVTGTNGVVKLWDAVSLTLRTRLGEHSAEITSCAFSPNGALLAAGAADGMVAVWDMSSRELLLAAAEHPGRAVRQCGFSPDGSWMYTAGENGRLKLWSTRREPACEFWADSPISSIAWRADNRRVVLGDAAGRVYILGLESWRPPPPIAPAYRAYNETSNS